MISINRDLKISNIKGLLIFLVVYSHFIELFKPHAYDIFLLMFAFHMPLFVFISGLLAKRARIDKVVNFLLIYLIFQTIYLIGLPYIYGSTMHFSIITPYYHMWYILSLSFWYLVAILVNKINLKTWQKIAFVIFLIIISATSRLFTNEIVNFISTYKSGVTSFTLSFQRTLYFAPFFFIGFFLNKEWWDKIANSIKYRKIFSIISIALVVYVFQKVDKTHLDSLYRGSTGYEVHDYALFEIAFSYLSAILLCYAVINLMSNKRNLLTHWGDRTLTIYLLHPFFMWILYKSVQNINVGAYYPKITILAYTFVICMLLSSKIVLKISEPIINPLNTIKRIKNEV